MRFLVVESSAQAVTPADATVCYLALANWNDWWEYKTLFEVIVVDPEGVQHGVGYTKIAKFGLAERVNEFEKVDRGV